MLSAVADFIATIEKRDAADQSLLAALEQTTEQPSAAHIEQLRRNLVARTEFLADVPLLSTVPAASPNLSRWKSEGRVFSLAGGDADLYPKFQLASATGEPLAAIGETLRLFRAWNEWQIALWFFAPNAWLGNRRPMDVIEHEPAAVLDAARRATESLDA